jgi:VIT1/CCC1 family predicted Fe2+/Mn2+ transporter
VLIVVEAISMAAGSYLSSQSAKELYEARIKQDHARVLHERVNDHESLAELFRRKGFSVQEIDVALAAISRERKMWIREVARLEYRHSPSVSTSPHRAAMIMGVFYVCGGVFTLIPYWVLPIDRAIPFAIIATFAALFGVGVLKATLTGANLWRSGIEVLVVSTIAAAIGYGIGVSLPAVLRGAMAV